MKQLANAPLSTAQAMPRIQRERDWQKSLKDFFAIFTVALCLIMPEMALAAPWDGPLQELIDILTGSTARLGAILAIIVLGFMAMTGRMNWGLAGGIIVGIVLIFGSAWIADTFIGTV